MEWLFDNFQVVALIAIVIGSLVKRFLEAKLEERQARERMDEANEEELFEPGEWQTSEMPPAVPPPSPGHLPPPLVRQMAPPPVPAALQEADGVLRRQLEMEERLRQIKAAKAAAGAAVSPQAKPRGARPAPAPATLRGALRNRGEIRRAVILREILGPPVGLR